MWSSLTQELKDRNSPVTRFVERVAPLVSAGIRQSPFGPIADRVLGLAACPRAVAVAPVAGANTGAVGTAFDYRLRYHLAPCRSDDLVARRGSFLLTRRLPAAAEPLAWWYENLDDLTERLAPAGRHLADADEELLARYCLVLSALESVYRSGQIPLLPPLATVQPAAAADPLLGLASEEAVRDLVPLSRSAGRTFERWIAQVTSGAVPYHPNPTFAGSRLMSADADIVVGAALFELKVTKNLLPAALRKALQQLVAYSLLDFDDRYRIRTAAVYFARQEWVSSWPLWKLVFPPGDVVQWVDAGEAPSDRDIELRLHRLCDLMGSVLRGNAFEFGEEVDRA